MVRSIMNAFTSNDRDADIAASDSAMITRALDVIAKCKADLSALSETAFRRNPVGNACDLIDDASAAFEDIEVDLQIGRTAADAAENDALILMESRP